MNNIEQDRARLLDTLRTNWPNIVGLDTAKASRPVAFDGESLIVETANAEYSHLLVFLESHIIRTAGAPITRIRFRVRARASAAVCDERRATVASISHSAATSAPCGCTVGDPTCPDQQQRALVVIPPASAPSVP